MHIKRVIYGLLWLMYMVYTDAAQAELTYSTDKAAGEDNIAPSPVTEVELVRDLGQVTISVSWLPSADDRMRQIPVAGDFTSGGVFAQKNDVAFYRVWQQVVGDERRLVAEVGSTYSVWNRICLWHNGCRCGG